MIPGYQGAPPKPPKRGPKAKKPIARTKLKPWRPDPKDVAWARKVRAKGPCAALGVSLTWLGEFEGGMSKWTTIHLKCEGRIEAAHGFRRVFQAIRRYPINGWSLCASIHAYFGRSPGAWEAFMRLKLGDAGYEQLRTKAMAGPKDRILGGER